MEIIEKQAEIHEKIKKDFAKMQNNIFNLNGKMDIHNPYHFFRKSYCANLSLGGKTNLTEMSERFSDNKTIIRKRNISLIPKQ